MLARDAPHGVFAHALGERDGRNRELPQFAVREVPRFEVPPHSETLVNVVSDKEATSSSIARRRSLVMPGGFERKSTGSLPELMRTP